MPLALKVEIEYKLVDDPGEECYLSCSLCLGLVQSVQYVNVYILVCLCVCLCASFW